MITTLRAGVLAAGCLCTAPTIAHAQDGAHTGSSVIALDEALYRARRDTLAQDDPQAWLLLGWGAANAVVGGTLGAIGVGGTLGRSTELNAAGWGVINAVIAVPWVLANARERRAMEADRAIVSLPDRRARRDARMRHWRGQALTFAVNTGLDVAYVAAGLLTYYIATQLTPRSDVLGGVGLAAAGEGLFLLGFDFTGWMTAVARTERLERVSEERDDR